ncbi:transglutaminase-like domain-containing protein [Bacteroidales bacterium OttesenSCG-928-B11]|nr:transglutaminase-like domain-containing protein [Bacteroidales bacterium OttesenSCG-928-E04]MDL2313256.1 transglutaminase-like domain-containing protein [Bacteroidales bacterium OttesenSCG-928-B11]
MNNRILNSISKLFLTFLFFCLIHCAYGQTTHKGYPVIKATSDLADIRFGYYLMKDYWTILPEIEADTLDIPFRNSEKLVFYTNVDSIEFLINSERLHHFYVCLNDTAYALTVVKGMKLSQTSLQFDENSKNTSINFWYDQNENNEYLKLLRSRYPIDSLIKEARTDMEKTLKILNWVHNQWQHNGSNEPRKNDAISILEEAKEGKNFRCVEYGIVAAACLNAIGLNSRMLALKTKDVETTEYGAGHVATEVFLNDLQKWVFIDGQFDAMPVLNGVPLNAVEFQKAIAENFDQLEIKTESDISKSAYVNWIYPYLYYFDVKFDNRESINNRQSIDGKSSLMLVPLGAKFPTIFQIRYPMDYFKYTHSLEDFYAQPNK